jgi:hypothetical protein
MPREIGVEQGLADRRQHAGRHARGVVARRGRIEDGDGKSSSRQGQRHAEPKAPGAGHRDTRARLSFMGRKHLPPPQRSTQAFQGRFDETLAHAATL